MWHFNLHSVIFFFFSFFSFFFFFQEQYESSEIWTLLLRMLIHAFGFARCSFSPAILAEEWLCQWFHARIWFIMLTCYFFCIVLSLLLTVLHFLSSIFMFLSFLPELLVAFSSPSNLWFEGVVVPLQHHVGNELFGTYYVGNMHD